MNVDTKFEGEAKVFTLKNDWMTIKVVVEPAEDNTDSAYAQAWVVGYTRFDQEGKMQHSTLDRHTDKHEARKAAAMKLYTSL